MQHRILQLHDTDVSHATQHAAGEALAKEMLSTVCGIPAETICFLRTEHGKPYIDIPNVHFSISHSDDRVMCAIHTSPVGADIQRIAPVRENVLQRVCTPAERAFIGADARRFAEVWTRKEAYAKLVGTGLSYGLQNIVVADENGLTRTVCDCHVITKENDGYMYSIVWNE